jgi:hypothetical protein
MSSFGMIFERMESDKIRTKEEEERLAIECIKDGLNIDEDFWKNFIMLLNNPENLGKLLGVPPIKISTWYSKIQKYLDKYLSSDEYDELKNAKKRKMVNTDQYDDFI